MTSILGGGGMSSATPQMRHLARRLIAFDASLGKSAITNNSDAFQVCDKLRPQLATLVGKEAFRALLAHALALACAEVPGLRAVHVKPDGTIETPDEILAQINANKFFEGRLVLVAQLLGLLVAFIGENLTARLVRETWPNIAIRDLDLDVGDKNENKK
jgi:hypothetical protein